MSDADYLPALAEASASEYVRQVPHRTPGQQQIAYEDYVAGFMAKQSKLEADMAFVLQQLQHLQEIASRESEFYSLSIIRYTLQCLGQLK